MRVMRREAKRRPEIQAIAALGEVARQKSVLRDSDGLVGMVGSWRVGERLIEGKRLVVFHIGGISSFSV
jgi:hypothetical protein